MFCRNECFEVIASKYIIRIDLYLFLMYSHEHRFHHPLLSFHLSSACAVAGNDREVTMRLGPLDAGFTREPQVFSLGQNSYGELMHGDTKERHDPVQVLWANGKFPVQVAVGNEFSAILTRDGTVYTSGYNKYGTCGVGSSKDRVLTPTLL